MDDAMRERATSQDVFEALQRVIIGGIKATVVAHGTSAESSWISSASKRIAKDVQHNFLADFASSEADRREQECIEYAASLWCRWCVYGKATARRHVNHSPARWFHDMEEHGLKECEADDLREWSYQRQQREKGDGNGR